MKVFTVTLVARLRTNNDFSPNAAINLADCLVENLGKANDAGSLSKFAVTKVEPALPDDRT